MSIKTLMEHLELLAGEGFDKGGEAEGDIIAVLRVATQMIDKLKISRAKGRGGWEDPNRCRILDLTTHLFEHIPKGDLIDVMNFCMMVHLRGQGELTDMKAFLSEMATAWAKGLCQEEFDFMENVYSDSQKQMDAELLKLRDHLEQEQRGEIRIDQPLTLETLQRGEKYMSRYMKNILTALAKGMPEGMTLICTIDNYRSDKDNSGMEVHLHVCDRTQVGG